LMVTKSWRVATPHAPQQDFARTMQSLLREHEPKSAPPPVPPDPVAPPALPPDPLALVPPSVLSLSAMTEPPQLADRRTTNAAAREPHASGFDMQEKLLFMHEGYHPDAWGATQEQARDRSGLHPPRRRS